MDALVWEAEPPRAFAPRHWPVRSPAGTTPPAPRPPRLTTAGGVLEAGGHRSDRPGGVLRLPGEPADDPPDRGADPRDRMARQRAPCRDATGRRTRDLVLLAGTEPNLRWRTFADGIAEIAERLGVEMVVTLGALIADVAHTLPVPITGLASDELVERLDLDPLDLRGPDRGRRRSPRRLPSPRHFPQRASGRPCRTTSPRSPIRRRPWRCCAASRGSPGSRSRPPAGGGGRVLRESGEPRGLGQPGDRGAGRSGSSRNRPSWLES